MQIVLILATVGLLVFFGVQNSDHVVLSLIIGAPVKVRLIFLLLTVAAAGFLSSHIFGLHRERLLKVDVRRLTALRNSTFSKIEAAEELEND
jgi:uncharacterized integral membrane protein